tara:strand:- start:1377 stop:2066 length:690 start_codon:yes stop_codon:yes gene_type:complete
VADPPIISLDGLYTLLALLVLSMLAVCFHLIRIFFNSPVDFSLDWNLFLSWIPLIVAFLANWVSKRFKRSHLAIIILSIFWLAFFPNAPYMVTDLSHLSDDLNRDLTWHDNIMLFYYAQVSLFNGLISLYWIHQCWNRLFSKRITLGLLIMSFPLAGLGVYLGRVRRLNSWDILHNPQLITEFLLASITDRTAWLLSFEIGILLAILYAVVWSIIRFRIRINKRLIEKP